MGDGVEVGAGPKSRPAKKGIKTYKTLKSLASLVRKADPPKRGLRLRALGQLRAQRWSEKQTRQKGD